MWYKEKMPGDPSVMGGVRERPPDHIEEGSSLDIQALRMQASDIMRGVEVADMHADPALSPDAPWPETRGHAHDTRLGVSGFPIGMELSLEHVPFLFRYDWKAGLGLSALTTATSEPRFLLPA